MDLLIIGTTTESKGAQLERFCQRLFDEFGLLESDDTIYFNEPECFDTEAEAFVYCAGIGYGVDERAPVERYPLRSSEETDLSFIEAIKLLMILHTKF